MAFASPSKLSNEAFNTSISSVSKENNWTQSTPLPAPTQQVWKSPNKAKYDPKTASTVTSVKSQIKTLQKQREQLEDEGRYLEAEAVHEQLTKLKVSEESKKKDSLKFERGSHLQALEVAHEQEMRAVRLHFDKELKEFELRVEQGLAEMQERHEAVLTEHRAKAHLTLDEATRTKFPPSKRLLEMRRAEKALARQHEYRQAHAMALSANALEKQEVVDRIARIKQTLISAEDRVKERLRHELAVFDQRNSSIRSTILENRRIEESTVNMRFQNKRSELLSTSVRVESVLDKRIEHLSPSKPTNRSRLSMNDSVMSTTSALSLQ